MPNQQDLSLRRRNLMLSNPDAPSGSWISPAVTSSLHLTLPPVDLSRSQGPLMLTPRDGNARFSTPSAEVVASPMPPYQSVMPAVVQQGMRYHQGPSSSHVFDATAPSFASASSPYAASQGFHHRTADQRFHHLEATEFPFGTSPSASSKGKAAWISNPPTSVYASSSSTPAPANGGPKSGHALESSTLPSSSKDKNHSFERVHKVPYGSRIQPPPSPEISSAFKRLLLRSPRRPFGRLMQDAEEGRTFMKAKAKEREAESATWLSGSREAAVMSAAATAAKSKRSGLRQTSRELRRVGRPEYDIGHGNGASATSIEKSSSSKATTVAYSPAPVAPQPETQKPPSQRTWIDTPVDPSALQRADSCELYRFEPNIVGPPSATFNSSFASTHPIPRPNFPPQQQQDHQAWWLHSLTAPSTAHPIPEELTPRWLRFAPDPEQVRSLASYRLADAWRDVPEGDKIREGALSPTADVSHKMMAGVADRHPDSPWPMVSPASRSQSAGTDDTSRIPEMEPLPPLAVPLDSSRAWFEQGRTEYPARIARDGALGGATELRRSPSAGLDTLGGFERRFFNYNLPHERPPTPVERLPSITLDTLGGFEQRFYPGVPSELLSPEDEMELDTLPLVTLDTRGGFEMRLFDASRLYDPPTPVLRPRASSAVTEFEVPVDWPLMRTMTTQQQDPEESEDRLALRRVVALHEEEQGLDEDADGEYEPGAAYEDEDEEWDVVERGDSGYSLRKAYTE